MSESASRDGVFFGGVFASRGGVCSGGLRVSAPRGVSAPGGVSAPRGGVSFQGDGCGIPAYT